VFETMVAEDRHVGATSHRRYELVLVPTPNAETPPLGSNLVTTLRETPGERLGTIGSKKDLIATETGHPARANGV
jgi:hypothetical protein